MLALEDCGAGGGRRAGGGDCGEQHVLGEGGEDVAGDAEDGAEGEGVAGGGGGQRPPGGQQRAARPDDQKSDQD
jgi:hypothetical protein